MDKEVKLTKLDIARLLSELRDAERMAEHYDLIAKGIRNKLSRAALEANRE
jgi:hypothetical protein